MRRALWILSAPVVAGGLAWAVNAADNQGPLLAGSPQAQNGRIYYFSRGAKTASNTAATDGADGSPDASADDAADGDTPPQRYVRGRPAPGTGSSSGTKNYYQELFAESDSGRGKSLQTVARRPTKPAPAAKQAVQHAGGEECGVDDSTDADAPREEVQLPPAGKNQQVSGVRQSGGVRHADHTVQDGVKPRVQQVQATRSAAAKGRAAPAATSTDEAAADADTAAPAPPPARPASRNPKVSVSKAAGVKANRNASAAKAAQAAAAAKAARKPQPAPKIQPVAASAPAPEEEPIEIAAPSTAPQLDGAVSGTGEVPMVSLRWVRNEEVNVGQESKCGLVVKNTGRLPAKDIVVEAYFPRTVRLIDADPFPSDSSDHLIWIFDHLEAGQEKTIEITMVPGRRGEMATSATVRFTGIASAVLNVEEPQLALSLKGSSEVMVGETLTQTITVSNPGTGVAHDVVVHVKVPEGLEHPRGRTVEMGIGSLGAGESRDLRLPLSANAGGEALLVVEARSTSNLIQKAEALIRVAAPRLGIEVDGPKLRYVNRHAQYNITVTNEGVAATDNVRVVHLVPEGFGFVKADKGGKYDSTTGSVSWFIGRLEAGESMQVAVDLNAKQIGEYLHHVQASGENGTIASAKLPARVDGTAAVVMEVSDLDDPVEVGTQTAYEIRVRNDGSRAAQNVRIACELPPGVDLIDTKGPTDHALEKGVLHFMPIGELPPGARVSYLVRVNGRVPGTLRLRAKLTSNASQDPLIIEEMTKFYAD